MSEPKSRLESPAFFVGVCLAVVLVGVVLWLAIVWAYPSLPDRANFGNLFGGINALYAGLAFAALVYTVVLQQRSLHLQRGELEAQRREIIEQNRRLERQAFETMLVELLGFHHDIARDITLNIRGGVQSGRIALRTLADELTGRLATRSREGAAADSIVIAQDGYERFHDAYRGVLDHYFRNLYHIVKLIDQSDIAEPRRYTSLVRAQLSRAELLLLFYNCLTPHGAKFKPLIEKYGFFEQLPEQELPIPGHRALYSNDAYR